MPVNLGTAVGYLTLDISGYARSLDAAKLEMDGFTKILVHQVVNLIKFLRVW